MFYLSELFVTFFGGEEGVRARADRPIVGTVFRSFKQFTANFLYLTRIFVRFTTAGKEGKKKKKVN